MRTTANRPTRRRLRGFHLVRRLSRSRSLRPRCEAGDVVVMPRRTPCRGLVRANFGIPPVLRAGASMERLGPDTWTSPPTTCSGIGGRPGQPHHHRGRATARPAQILVELADLLRRAITGNTETFTIPGAAPHAHRRSRRACHPCLRSHLMIIRARASRTFLMPAGGEERPRRQEDTNPYGLHGFLMTFLANLLWKPRLEP